MKRRLCFALAATIFTSACAPLSDTEKQFRLSIAAAQLEEAVCPKFTESHQMAIKATRSFKRYPDRDSALAALSLLEARPVEYPKSREAANFFSAHEEELLGSMNRMENLAIAGSIPPECEIFLAMQALPMLYDAARTLPLKGNDRARLRAVTAQFLWDRIPNGRVGIILYAVQARVLEAYLEEGYEGANQAPLLAEARRLTDTFETGRRQIFKPIGKLESIVDGYTLKRVRAEMKFKREFAKQYAALLTRVVPKPGDGV
ncbi:MAG: hypothetical protein EOP11_15400 [Proteobacteria bacterium]|nr:MAG: hypothetical protein EOP11_15400 [Pseudomonadota bacterium]